MKKIEIFSALFASLAVGFMLTAFTHVSTVAPVKVIVDEVVFLTEVANLVQDTSMTALNNLPTKHQKKQIADTIFWYIQPATVKKPPSPRHEGYFVRIEQLATMKVKKSTVLEFKMILTPENKTATIFLPSPKSTDKKRLMNKTTDGQKGNMDILLQSASKLTCRFKCNDNGFKITNIKGLPSAKYQVTVFSKDNI